MTNIFASDYDGTLFKDFIIRDEDIEAIKKFRSLGHKFGIVTGRSINSILDEVQSYNIPVDFLVGVNGGIVLDHEMKEVNAHKMDESVTEELLKCIDEYGVKSYGVNDGYYHTRVLYEDIKAGENLEDFEKVLANGISGMYIATHGPEDSIELANIINERFKENEVRCFANESYVDVGTIHNSKTTGIEDIIKNYNYTGQVFSVGDSYNDIPMLKDFNGYLMDNGVRELLKFAKCGLVSTVGEAIYKTIDKLEL